MEKIPISNKRRILEICAVILTAIGKFIFMDFLNWRFLFVVVSILLWSTYIFNRSKKQKGILKYWGFRTDNFKTVLKKVFPFGIISIIAFLNIGFIQGTINLTWHLIPILITYPIWGTIQQFLLISLVAGNLQDLKLKEIRSSVIILFSAMLFSIVHYPIGWLMIGTFILAIFYGYIYLRNRNLYVLGLFHGWLGGLFYYTVLNTDPFLQTFGKLLS
ncbi:MAG: CPBP family intramembrane metalloprotease [Flavobacteriaceae bacterium]|jgi:membrane protease YdiL (CAAX protease family)|nr:CPBP family intramembrane metalloprotease [Flavobacteriaceae bacterium]MCB0486579.1 CPBP family intramembrane metalloprotease [Flavobacteriaceae bacterium]